MNVTTMSTAVAECQQALLEAAIELMRLDHRLRGAAAAIPLPVDFYSESSDLASETLEGHLYGLIHAVRQECLHNAVRALWKGADEEAAALRLKRRAA